MDISDIELMESLPIGILVDSNIKSLDKYGYNFALSGVDFETCVTLACVTEVVKFSPIKIIISEKEFVGGSIVDLVNLSRTSEKHFNVVLWTESKLKLSNEFLKRAGIAAVIDKSQPFDKILKKIKQLMSN